MTQYDIKVGDRIKFKGEHQRYTVRAASGPFAICTKPFNLKKTVLYTIVDFTKEIRGSDDYIFGKFDYAKTEECEEALTELHADMMRISRRNSVTLQIEGVN